MPQLDQHHIEAYHPNLINAFHINLCFQRSGGWSSTLNHPWLNGQGLHDSTVGIIGYGRIGHSVAMKLKSFLPKQILYTSREEKPTGICFYFFRFHKIQPSFQLD